MRTGFIFLLPFPLSLSLSTTPSIFVDNYHARKRERDNFINTTTNYDIPCYIIPIPHLNLYFHYHGSSRLNASIFSLLLRDRSNGGEDFLIYRTKGKGEDGF